MYSGSLREKSHLLKMALWKKGDYMQQIWKYAYLPR